MHLQIGITEVSLYLIEQAGHTKYTKKAEGLILTRQKTVDILNARHEVCQKGTYLTGLGYTDLHLNIQSVPRSKHTPSQL